MSAGTSKLIGIASNAWARNRGRLFWKYATLVVGVVCVVLVANGLVWVLFSYQDHRAALIRIQREQAEAAAAKIGQFIENIESQLGWMTQLPWTAVSREQRRFDALRLLRQAPAITELSVLDDDGREQLRVSRMELDVVGSGIDRSNEPLFVEAKLRRTFYGAVYLHRGSEPHMTLALSGGRGDAGIVVAKINLRLIWDVVSQIKVGKHGGAYVVDTSGRLIAHPDVSLVLRNTDLSSLEHVRAARAGGALGPAVAAAKDVTGRSVLTAHAAIAPLGWLVFVELPAAEAFAPLYASLIATGVVLLCGLALALLASLFLARKLVTPIQALETGAARIGAGALDHRIEIRTGDELQALGDRFNSMAAQLENSYATLERKVEERTQQLQLANLAKSRFLAAASHDLRQPLHALNLFVDQLRFEGRQEERERLVAQIGSSVAAMNELFNALLDISKLDAGVLKPNITEFPISLVLDRVEATFLAAARAKGLTLRLVSSGAWIKSDSILLERVLLNLVSNAVRYTAQGGIVIGCRQRANQIRIEVVDSGIGIPRDQLTAIFGEFHRLAGPDRTGTGGLGLGLAIVDRLCHMLDHPIEVQSQIGHGSRFAVLVPRVAVRPEIAQSPGLPQAMADPARGKVVLVIDDDPLVRDGMRGLLQSWGCKVVAAASDDAAIACFGDHTRRPDLIISDYHLQGDDTGFAAIARLHRVFDASIPAFVISGDTDPERLQEATARGYHLLHKPVLPMNLRAVVSQLLKGDATDHPIEDARSIAAPLLGANPNSVLPPR